MCIKKLRQRFCKHEFDLYWRDYYESVMRVHLPFNYNEFGYRQLIKVCKKCGKVVSYIDVPVGYEDWYKDRVVGRHYKDHYEKPVVFKFGSVLRK